MTEPVYVIGASGRSGAALSRSLLADGITVVPVVRNAVRWHASDLRGTPRVADLRAPDALRAALSGATRIVSCAYARHTASILAAAPAEAKLVLLGSTCKFSRWPTANGNGVLAGEAALLGSDRRGVMLHPTMIYGAPGENNVQRLASLIRRLPVVPLPGGGRFLVQPIHQSDVTRSIKAALERDWKVAESLVIAGPEPVSYVDFVRAIADACSLPPPRILPFPAAPLILLARLTQHVTTRAPVRPDEIRRLLEDKAFSIDDMRSKLGVEPIPLAKGLALTFAVPQYV